MKINRSFGWLPASGLCLLAGCQSSPPIYPKVQIGRVISGQSVEWIDRSQQPPVIQQGKLAGIEAPDLAQEPWGKQAKQRLEALVKTTGKEGISIEFDSAEADKYGRRLIYLWKDDRFTKGEASPTINEQLLKEGCVLASIRTPTAATVNGGNKYRDRFFRASQYARLMGLGIWNPDLPMRMSPAEFRKEER